MQEDYATEKNYSDYSTVYYFVLLVQYNFLVMEKKKYFFSNFLR